MQLYAIRRRNGWADAGRPPDHGRHLGTEGDKPGSGVRWIRSYVLGEEAGDLGTVCIYEADSPEAIRAHAEAVGDARATRSPRWPTPCFVRPDPVAGRELTRAPAGGRPRPPAGPRIARWPAGPRSSGARPSARGSSARSRRCAAGAAARCCSSPARPGSARRAWPTSWPPRPGVPRALGRAPRKGAAAPYGPVVAALRLLPARRARTALDGCGPLRPHLALILPELGEPRRPPATGATLVEAVRAAPSPTSRRTEPVLLSSTTSSGPTTRPSSCWRPSPSRSAGCRCW